ncbi:MAG: hypothetical protein A3B68_04185 [Candidatus Melainabacteria bacterium RIFCSPHIGHO2_02_FULL_34_12]|nr:MAG: hypothetical protein A3B68_04185 [Candidatus Melainabacteria bacterium RIFCSPHIGHO2_02_FULL_34_12]
MPAIKTKQAKPVDIVEITAAVPQEQLNTLRQMIIRYILDHNKEDVAYKLLDLTHTRLRDDVKFYSKEN